MRLDGDILIISGGTIDDEWLKCWIGQQNIGFLIAVDRGLETVHRLGLHVDYILGDYDSVDRSVLDDYRDDTEVVTFKPEKDYTDTHLALKKAIEVALSRKNSEHDDVDGDDDYGVADNVDCDDDYGAAGNVDVNDDGDTNGNVDVDVVDDGKMESHNIYIVGATGTRLDHAMTNIFVLKEALDAGVEAYILDSHNKIYMRGAGSFVIEKAEQYGKYVSFVPVTERVVLSLEGMKYNLSEYELKQGLSICQSNEIADRETVVSVRDGVIIVIEARD